MNLMNGIAFGSHGARFKAEVKMNEQTLSPGPGQYNIPNMPSQRRGNQGEVATSKGGERVVWEQKESVKYPGPGSYFAEGPSMVKRSFNITLPQNAIAKQKENVLSVRCKSWLH